MTPPSHGLVLLLLVCLTAVAGCGGNASQRKQAAAASDREFALKLFGDHRHALPRYASSIPFPQEGKYWEYTVALEYPDPNTCLAELRHELEQQLPPERTLRCAMLRQLGEIPPVELETALLSSVEDFLAGEGRPEDFPPVTELLRWLKARYPLSEASAIQELLLTSGVYNSLDVTTPLERTDLAFEAYVRVHRDFQRLTFANQLVVHWQLTSLAMQLRPIATEPANSFAMRMEAARTLYALGHTDQRPLLLYLGFGDSDTIPLYGWPTYAFLAEQRDAETYQTLRNLWQAAPKHEQGQYLVHLAVYGNAQDLPALEAWIREGLPQLPEQRIAPEGSPALEPAPEPAENALWLPESGVRYQFAQDAHTPAGADPHAGISEEEFAAALGYDTTDINTALRLRLLRHFGAAAVLPLLHEAVLKGGPATRVATAELLGEIGTEASAPLLKLTWEDEVDPMVLAELAYAWLRIDARLHRASGTS